MDKERALALIAGGWTQAEVARAYGVQPAAISKIVNKAANEPEVSTVQPVASGDLEMVRPATPRPVEATPIPKPSEVNSPASPSEWRGVQLAGTLAERHRQITIMQGEEAARDFARRESAHLVRSGVSVEAISQQLDMPVAEVQALLAEARQRALDAIANFDPRLSLAAALSDIEIARRETLRALNAASTPPSLRAAARRMMLQCAEAEITLAVQIAQYKRAAGLDATEGDDQDLDRLSFWMNIPKAEHAR